MRFELGEQASRGYGMGLTGSVRAQAIILEHVEEGGFSGIVKPEE